MPSNTNENRKLLYVIIYDVCVKIQNESTRLESLYRYAYNNDWDAFCKFAKGKNADENIANIVFNNAVFVIKNQIDAFKIHIAYKKKKSDDLLNYMAGIRRNKLMDYLSKAKMELYIPEKPNASSIPKTKRKVKDIYSDKGSKAESINVAYHTNIGEEQELDYAQMYNIQDVLIPLIEYIYAYRLTDTQRRNYQMFYIERLSLNDVVNRDLEKYEDFFEPKEKAEFNKLDNLRKQEKLSNLREKRYDTAKQNKSNLKKAIKFHINQLSNNEQFIDNIRFNNGNLDS